MAFPTGYLSDPQAVGAGETLGVDGIDLSADVFEDGLVIGRFAKLDTGSLDNIDASVAPVIAGVVLRNTASAVEDGNTITDANANIVEYRREGIVTVDVVSADSPAQFGIVYVKNAAGADAGKATTVNDATTVAADAEFLHEVQTDVWAIRLK